jgi:hypothetical protein
MNTLRMSRVHEHRMIEVTRGVSEAGTDILGFQIRIVLKDFRLPRAFREHIGFASRGCTVGRRIGWD